MSAQPVSAEAHELDRPPFAVVAALGPEQVADEMVACFARLGARPDRLEHAHALALRSIGVVEDGQGIGQGVAKRDSRTAAAKAGGKDASTDKASSPMGALARAGRAIARDIDRGIGVGITAGYHNPQHFLEVMLSTRYLARLAGLDARRSARVVTAGLIHDFHHDGSRGASAPFRLELLALEKAAPYLNHAGIDADSRTSLEALVLATEPRTGVPYARACWLRHRGLGGAAQRSPGLPRGIEPLELDAELAADAVLLAEADVLPSIGLTLAHADKLQARLSAEWGMALGRDDKLQFIDRMVSEITVAKFFIPNMQRLRESYARAS
jgi:hypothetical protein